MRHINIPIFIPHLGCPNQCIFCNQKYISGTQNFDETDVDNIINDVLSTVNKEDTCEIAFFGGSFTGIDRSLMIRLLDMAQGYVNKGQVIGIRMSTRPDYINEEIVDILKRYTVTYVELGIQSMNDSVLSYLKRGHTSKDTINATRLLKSAGLPFVGQMMIGLPTATIEDEIYCAEIICNLGASGTRIYPTLVFKNTELEEVTKQGEYLPLTIDEAVKRSADVFRIFTKNNVKCFRIGLCESDNLHSNDTFFAGPNSPSIGEMVKSQAYFDIICELLDKNAGFKNKKSLTIVCPNGKTSQIVGNKRRNLIELRQKFGFRNIKVIENSDFVELEVKLQEMEESQCV